MQLPATRNTEKLCFSFSNPKVREPKIPRPLACLFNCGQRAGGSDQMTKREERFHSVPDAKCFSYRSRTAAFSSFAMNASRSFHVIAAKRRHSFPPIWLKMAFVNLPSAVRRAAFARTPVATLAVVFGRLTGCAIFFSAAARLFRSFAGLFCFLPFFILCSLHRTREPYACLERSKVLIKSEKCVSRGKSRLSARR
jgi:hypothetical protein